MDPSALHAKQQRSCHSESCTYSRTQEQQNLLLGIASSLIKTLLKDLGQYNFKSPLNAVLES